MMHFHDLPGVIFARVTVQQNCRQHRPSFTDMLTDTQSTHVLTDIFPGEPGLAGF